MDQGPDGALKTVFLKYGYNLGMDEPADLKFCKEVKDQKIFDTCPGFLQNLDQGPDEALKTVFLKYRYYFGMNGPRDLKFFSNNRESKNIGHMSRGFPKFRPGAGRGL